MVRRPQRRLSRIVLVLLVALAAVVALRRGAGVDRTAATHGGDRGAGEEEVLAATLFFGAEDASGLVSEARDVPVGEGAEDEAVRRVFAEWARGPRERGVALLPRDAALRRVFRDGEGTLVLDVNRAFLRGTSRGSAGELLTVRALMETMSASFPELRSIQILVEGQVVTNISGHVAIDAPLRVRP
jgi:spore germination protein GerM